VGRDWPPYFTLAVGTRHTLVPKFGWWYMHNPSALAGSAERFIHGATQGKAIRHWTYDARGSPFAQRIQLRHNPTRQGKATECHERLKKETVP